MKNTPQLPWLDRFYLIRVVMVLMILAVIAVRETFCADPATYYPGLFLFGAAYPHLVQLVLGRFEGRRLRGRYSLLADGFFAGAVMPAIAFGAIPCAVLLVVNLFNWMALGGVFLTALGLAAMLVGLGFSGALVGFGVAGNGCVAADYLSYGVLLAYFLLVAAIVFRYSTALRRHCDELQVRKDAAEMGAKRAERALMAVLPAYAALEHADGGGVSTTALADATLLLADFALPQEEVADIRKLEAIFGACDEILSRHAIEGVKTFGRRYLAVAAKQAGPENALVAALEIIAFLTDHGMVPGASDKPCRVRIAIHCGPVVAGLIQAEKFSYDVIGATVDELVALVDEDGTAAIRISAAARSRLQRDWRLVPLPGNRPQPVFTPVEHGGA